MKAIFQTMMAPLAGGGVKSAVDMSPLVRAWFGGSGSKSGVAVNYDTALKVTTALACGRVIAEGVSQLPLQVGEVDDEGAFDVRRNDPYYKLLYRRPNDWQTSFEFRETLLYNAIFTGWGIAIKNVLPGKGVVELLPIPRTYVQWERRPNWGVIFHINDPWGAIGTFQAKDLVILRGPSWDGIIPFDIINLAREALGLAIATEEAHARLHANGARPGGIISFDGSLGDEARERIKDRAQGFTGADAFRTMVLDMGAKFYPMSMTGVDSQHLETRRLQIEEICRAFRVFPHMVGYADKTTTFASAESFFQGHVLHTLMPWVERLEQVLDRDVCAARGLSARLNVRELLKGDTGSRASFYASGIVNGWLTRNDARRMEGLMPLDNLDEPLAPLNMAPVGRIITGADPEKAKSIKTAAVVELDRWLAENGAYPADADQREQLTARVAERIFAELRCAA